LQHLDAVELWHHHIQNNGVVFRRHCIFISVKAVVHGIHAELVLFKGHRQRLRQINLVLRNQQMHASHPPFSDYTARPEKTQLERLAVFLSAAGNVQIAVAAAQRIEKGLRRLRIVEAHAVLQLILTLCR
jgi:hypothetical protein